jgi:RNA polymerase sigma-70 factor (ECF subfamily)
MQEQVRGDILPASVESGITQYFLLARAGSDRGFEALVQRLSPEIAGSLGRLLHGDADAVSAAVQDAWTAAWQEFARFCSEEHLVRWLHRVARCRAISALRKRRPRITISWTDGVSDVSNPFQAISVHAESDHGLSEELCKAIRCLPEAYRGIAILHYLHGQQIKEVATLVRLSVPTVKMRLRRARLQLRRRLHSAAPSL